MSRALQGHITTVARDQHDPYILLASAVILRAWDDFWMHTPSRVRGVKSPDLTIRRCAMNLLEAIRAGEFLFEPTDDPVSRMWWELCDTTREAAMHPHRLDGYVRLANLRVRLDRLLDEHPNAFVRRKRRMPESYRPRRRRKALVQ